MNIIVFNLENENGFFSVFFFLLHTYIYCCKNNIPFYIKDDKWKFLYENGLDDYIILNDNIFKYNFKIQYNSITVYSHMNVPNVEITLNEYIKYSKEIYKINSNIINNYDIPEIYNSIFIRGGDKLLYEAKQLPISDYVNKLLNINNDTKNYSNNVFIHSDDNLLVEEVIKYININNIYLNCYKITNTNTNGGAVVIRRLKYGDCAFIKSVDEMNKYEIKEHTSLMINAIEIMRKSKNVICSFDTNVSRFMKINFDCNVYSINGEFDFNLDKNIMNPAYGFM